MLIAENCVPLAGLRDFYSPAGLDLGGESPDEIALSIVAEIQAVMTERHAGFLRDRRARFTKMSSSHAWLRRDNPCRWRIVASGPAQATARVQRRAAARPRRSHCARNEGASSLWWCSVRSRINAPPLLMAHLSALS